jgi:hypothetical protein
MFVFLIACLNVVLIVAIFFGAFAFKKSKILFRLFFIQITYTMLVEVIKKFHHIYQTNNKIPINNLWIGNINLLVEQSIIFLALYVFLSKRWEKNTTIVLYLTFVTSYLLNIYGNSFWDDLNYADLMSCFLLTFVLVYIYFQIAQSQITPFWKSPEKIAIMGLLIYYAGSIPFIAMWDYLMTNSMKVLGYLYYGINYSIALIRYIFLGIAFWLLYKNAKKRIISA